MIMIIAHHFAVHSGFNFPTNTVSVNRLWIQFIQLGGKIGVNVFVLISGFFLVSTDKIKTSKIIRLWGQMFFYSIVILIGFILTGIEPFGIKALIKSIAPVTFSQWWFASTYFVLYLISPYINLLLNSFKRRQYLHFLILLFSCWCIVPTLTGQSLQSNDLLWFVFLYSLAGYIRKFEIQISLSCWKLLALSVVGIVLTFISAVIFDALGTKLSFFGNHATFFYGMQQFPMLVVSLLMFFGFSKLNCKNNKIINVISSTTFGIYLIHDHTYVRNFIWKSVFANASYANCSMLIPHSLLAIAAVFAGSMVIELLRLNMIEKSLIPAVDRIASYIDRKLEDRLFIRVDKWFER